MTPPNYATAKRKVQVYIQSPASKVDNFCILLPVSLGAIIDKIILSILLLRFMEWALQLDLVSSDKNIIFTERSVFKSGQRPKREGDKNLKHVPGYWRTSRSSAPSVKWTGGLPAS